MKNKQQRQNERICKKLVKQKEKSIMQIRKKAARIGTKALTEIF